MSFRQVKRGFSYAGFLNLSRCIGTTPTIIIPLFRGLDKDDSGPVDVVCATKDESKICLTCPMATVFCDSAKVADISNPSMAKTAFDFGIYGLLSHGWTDTDKLPVVPWGNEQGQHRS